MQHIHSPHYLTERDLLALVEKIDRQGAADWQLFLNYAEELALVPGDVLIAQHDVDRVIHVLTQGQLEVRAAAAPDAPPQSLGTVKPVAILGEHTFLDGQPRTTTITASSPAIVHRITLAAFDRLRTEEPEIACAFLFDVARSLSLRARPLQAKIAEA